MLDHEFNTDPVSPYAELCRQLVATGIDAYALERVPGSSSAQRVATGDAATLIAQAGLHDPRNPRWAVVAPIRPELIVVDIDLCADEVLSHVLDAAGEVAAAVAYLAASGSPDSVHAALAMPTEAARHAFIAAIEAIKNHHPHLKNTALQLRPQTGPLRLPGSASLKGGNPCRPIDETGREITAVAAVRRLRAALASVDPTTAVRPHTPPPPPAHGAGRRIRRGRTSPDLSLARMGADPPRAWRREPRMAAEQFRVLTVEPRTVGERSDIATAAAWKLWERGFRKGANIEAEYRRWPAFAKFVAKDDDARTRGRHLEPGWTSHCQAHWEGVARRAELLRPADADPADAELISDVLAEVAAWDDPALVAAAVATINRFGDGYGTRSRPISVRCMLAWLNITSLTTANSLIKGLCRRGLLILVRPHDAHTAGSEASQYDLSRPDPIYRTDRVHEVTDRSAVTHPLWGQLGQHARHTWQVLHLHPQGAATSTLAAHVGLPPGTPRHGLGRVLRKLEFAGLAQPTGHGRGRRWLPTRRQLDDAAIDLGVPAARRALMTRVNLERAAWHAQSQRARIAARGALQRLQKRCERAPGPLQLVFAEPRFAWGAGTANRPTERRSRAPAHRRHTGPPRSAP